MQLSLRVGSAIVLFAVALTIGAALLAGLWPAWRASRSAPALDLRQLHTQRGANRLGRWIVPTQVALGIVLIYAALLLTGTLRNYLSGTLRIRHESSHLRRDQLPERRSPSSQEMVRRSLQIVDQVAAAHGVRAASLLNMPPVRGWSASDDFFSRDSHGKSHHDPSVWGEDVTPGYFAALGTAILQGRAFAQSDIAADKVCIVRPLGGQFLFPWRRSHRPVHHRRGRHTTETRLEICTLELAHYRSRRRRTYAESAYNPRPRFSTALTEQEKDRLRQPVPGCALGQRTVRRRRDSPRSRQILPGATPPKIYSFDEMVSHDLSRQRMLSGVSGGFALLALALVATGLYGILSRSVTERRREIGIRMALGARRQQIVSTLARGTALRILIGVVAGAALAAAAGRFLQSLLYGVSAGSPLIALATLAVLLAVLTVAFIFPAGRAASVDPMEAIRDE